MSRQIKVTLANVQGQLQSIAFQIPIAFIEGVVMLVAAYATNKYKTRWIPLVWVH